MPIFNPTTLTGTANQVLVNGNAGTVEAGLLTLSLPQNIGTASSPTFNSLTLSSLTGYLYGNGAGAVSASTTIPNSALQNSSITVSAGTGISVSGSPVSLGGTVTVTNTGVTSFSAGTTGLTPNTGTTGAVTLSGILNAVNGGTGQSTYAVGDILFANTTTTLSRLAGVATGNALISGGINTAPSWGKIGLTTHVNGVLPATNGGTGQNTYATGDIIFASNSTTLSKLAIGTNAQVLTSTGTSPTWSSVLSANATGTVGVSPSGGGTAWTLISGNSYRADFVHNLGTTNVVVTVWDTSNNNIVIPQTVTTINTSTVRISVIGNTRTLKVVVIANGQSIVAGGSTPSSVITAFEGVDISTASTRLNFRGQAVGVTDAGSGTTNITIGSRFSYFANSLDSPNSADFAVNSLAPVTTDPTFTSLNVRSFSNTVEQGVGCTVSIPTGATTLTIKIRGRPQTAPGTASVVQPRLYYRLLPNNSAVGSWSAAQELANISIPTNANFQYSNQTISLSTLGLVAGNLYQFEFTRRVTGVVGTNLGSNFLMAEITLEFA